MALRVRLFTDIARLNTHLRGGIEGGKDLRRAATFEIHGKTLVFTAPSATVTFDTPNDIQQEGLALSTIVTQINAVGALAGFARVRDGHVVIESPTGNVNVTLGGAGTANKLLGFDSGGVTGKFFAAPGGSAPSLVAVEALSTSQGFIVITDE